MITRFEQIMGFLTLTGVGAGMLLSRFVTMSTTYFIEVNFGLSQYTFGTLFFIAAVPIALRRISRQMYTVCLIPYGIYWIGNIRYVSTAGLSSVVPWIVTILLFALNWFVFLDIIKAIIHLWSQRDKQHTNAPSAG